MCRGGVSNDCNCSMIQLKSWDEIQVLRRANMLVYEVLQTLKEMSVDGVTTLDLDRRAHEMTLQKGAVPAFLGYKGSSAKVIPFPGVICASVNDEIVHGVPNSRPLKNGDILSVDYGCSMDGFFGDAAITFAIGGSCSEGAQLLIETTEQCLNDAIEQCRDGRRIGDISAAVQKKAESRKFGVVREFVGHGIGRAMHEPPSIPNFGKANQGRVLRVGMVIAIEPMITQGGFETKILDDGWTAVTKDGSLAAHFEHSVAITSDAPYVLSRP